MKTSRYKKVLGIAIGEKSLLIAEVVGGATAVDTLDRPEVRVVAELPYADEVSLETPAKLGAALSELLREKRIGANAAVIGLPARLVVAATKELPDSATDATTRADILRLSAESEFSAELKDLVFDYVDDAAGGTSARNALLMATPRQNIDRAVAIARAAKLKAVAILPTAVALGNVTARAATTGSASQALVLAIGAGGAELTAQQDGSIRAMRHLRSSTAQAISISDLRRAVSTLPSARSTLNGNGLAKPKPRELIVWNGESLDTEALSSQTGYTVRRGELASLGVRAGGGQLNGAGGSAAYGPAVALAMVGIKSVRGKGVGERPAIDFLHSRLAPTSTRRIPRWTWIAGVAALLAILVGIWAYRDLQRDQFEVDRLVATWESRRGELAVAEAFVTNVSFAQAWHGGDPRYLACVRDLTLAIPDDGQTIATSLVVREKPKPAGTAAQNAAAKHANDPLILSGQLYGKTSNQELAQTVRSRIQANPGFTNVKLGGTQDAGRNREVTFSITFDYLPVKAALPPVSQK